jgi:PilZ domain
MECIKIFISDQYQGTVTCSSCGNKRVLNMLKYSGRFANMGDKSLKVKCKCNHVAEIICEFRKFPRVKVNLKGTLFQRSTKKPFGNVTIDSLSLGGVGFFLHSSLAVKKGEIFELLFTLDDAEQSVVREEVTVRRVHGNAIGVEFRDKNKYNYELDFYITGCYEDLETTMPLC